MPSIVRNNGVALKTRCIVCEQTPDVREEIEAAATGKSAISVAALLRNHPEWRFTPMSVSNHKQNCMGLALRVRAIPQPETTTAVVVHESWVPTAVRDKARDVILRLLGKLETQIEVSPTAAYYQVALGYCQVLLTESEKTGGAPLDRMKSYAEEVKAKLDTKSKREITRTITMKETVTEESAKPTGETITVLSPADSL